MERIKVTYTGFPSPARDYEEKPLDLNKFIISNTFSTFFMRVEDDFEEENIKKGDIIVVDTSIEKFEDRLIVAEFKCDFVIGRIIKEKGKKFFISKSIREEIEGNIEFEVFGVITFLIRKI